MKFFHECPTCGQICYCDGEDHGQPAPPECECEMNDDDDDDDQEDENWNY